MSLLRFATSTDHFQIKEIFSQVEPSAQFNWTDSSIELEIRQSLFMVDEVDGVIRAFIAYREAGDDVEIIALATAASFSRQLIMQGLLKYFVEFFSKKSMAIHLEVHCQNIPALKLYQKCGFEPIRTRKGYYKDGADALVMYYPSKCL